MAVQINKAGADDKSLCVKDGVAFLRRLAIAHPLDQALFDKHIGHVVNAVRRINDAPVADE
jgi:hypothetical protein